MLSLFEQEPVTPAGFYYVPDFLSAENEGDLVSIIQGFELRNMQFHQYEAKRKTANFGMKWSFEERTLSDGTVIPTAFNFLIEKLGSKFNFEPAEVKQLLITEYAPGTVINWHRDAPPFDKIIGVSLLSACNFRFRPYEKAKQGRKSIINLNVQPRSAYIMEGVSRSEWEHSISPVKALRYSITVRTLR